MKTSFQLSIDIDLKQRLINFSIQTGIPVSRIISNMLRKYLPEEEKKYNIQLSLEETNLSVHSKKGKRIK